MVHGFSTASQDSGSIFLVKSGPASCSGASTWSGPTADTAAASSSSASISTSSIVTSNTNPVLNPGQVRNPPQKQCSDQNQLEPILEAPLDSSVEFVKMSSPFKRTCSVTSHCDLSVLEMWSCTRSFFTLTQTKWGLVSAKLTEKTTIPAGNRKWTGNRRSHTADWNISLLRVTSPVAHCCVSGGFTLKHFLFSILQMEKHFNNNENMILEKFFVCQTNILLFSLSCDLHTNRKQKRLILPRHLIDFTR